MKFKETYLVILLLFLINTSYILSKSKLTRKINKDNKNNIEKCNLALPLNERDKLSIVQFHNHLRNLVASQDKSLGITLPKASNMMQIYWDNQLANQAQLIANNCSLKHSSYHERQEKNFRSSENIYHRKFKEGRPNTHNFPKAIKFWFSKIIKFKSLDKIINSFNYQGVNTDSFVQIIWANTYKVGCGYSVFEKLKNKKYIIYDLYVCLYSPPGLEEKRPIYETAQQEKCKCPNLTNCSNKDYKNLCCPVGFCSKDNLFYDGEDIKS